MQKDLHLGMDVRESDGWGAAAPSPEGALVTLTPGDVQQLILWASPLAGISTGKDFMGPE